MEPVELDVLPADAVPADAPGNGWFMKRPADILGSTASRLSGADENGAMRVLDMVPHIWNLECPDQATPQEMAAIIHDNVRRTARNAYATNPESVVLFGSVSITESETMQLTYLTIELSAVNAVAFDTFMAAIGTERPPALVDFE